MTTFQVAMQQSASLGEEEKRRRLHQVYSYILGLRLKKFAGGDKVEDFDPPTANGTLATKPDTQD